MACTPNANALVTLERVKLELGIDPSDTSKDELLCELINDYSDIIEELLGRSLVSQAYDEDYPGSNNQNIVLNNFPVTVLTEVSIEDEVITDYIMDGYKQRRLFRDVGWPKSSYGVWMSNHPIFPTHNINVKYTAGYVLPANTPGGLKRAILILISMDQAQEGTSKGLAAFKISDVSWTFLKDVNPAVYKILSKFRSQVL